MKKKIYQLMACVAMAASMLTACQDLDSAYNNLPVLGEVALSGSQQELTMTLTCQSGSNNFSTNGYFLLSRSGDMNEAEQVGAAYLNGQWTATVDLLPATTYYAQLCLERKHGVARGPVTEFTTSNIGEVRVSSVTSSSAYLYYTWKRDDYSATFLVSTSPDLTGATQYDARRSGNSYYANVSGLSSGTKYFAAVRLSRTGGVSFTTPTTEFTTLTTASASISGSDILGYGGFFVEGSDGSVSSNASGNSWEGYITGETNIYVYKPYQKGSFSYQNVPLYYYQEYFEYGRTTISPTNTKGTCSMQRLSTYQVELNILPHSTNGATTSRSITSVEIANSGTAQAICTAATVNLATGVITPTKNSSAVWSQSAKIALASEKASQLYYRSIIPLSFGDGEVKVNIVLNNTSNMTYEVVPVTLPASTWKGGERYTYDIRVNYTRNDVEVTVSDVKVTPWNNNGNTNIDIYD